MRKFHASKSRIISAIVGYGAVGWGLIQVLATILPVFNLPNGIVSWSIISVFVAFPFYIILVIRRPEILNLVFVFNDKHDEPAIQGQDDINRLLVSKFKILREGTATDFLAFSLPEAITNALVGVNKLSVQLDTDGSFSRHSSEELAVLSKKRKLNAILTGSVLTIGNEVRVSTSLSEQPSNTVIWTEAAQSEVGNLFELQDKITRRIIKSLQLKLSPAEEGNLERKNTRSAEAYELYLKANQLSLQASGWETARDLYISCIEKDPSFSPALARLGRCYRILAKYTSKIKIEDAIRNFAYSKVYLDHALRLDPNSDLAVGLMAQLDVDLGQPLEALKTLLHRISINSSNANLYASLVHVFRSCGLLNESVRADSIARSIDPGIVTSIGHTHWMMGNYAMAKMFTIGDIGYLDPASCAALGETAVAIAKLTEKLSTTNTEFVNVYLSSFKFALEAKKTESLKQLELAITPGIDGEALYHLVRIYGFFNETDKAIAGIRLVIEKGYFQPYIFLNDSWLDSVRHLPDFTQLVEIAAANSNTAQSILATTSQADLSGALKKLTRLDTIPA